MAGLNGKAKQMPDLDKPCMVHPDDLERSQLEVSLQAVRDNPDARRPDGRKSPYMLCAQEAMRLDRMLKARNQELETLRAQLRLAHEEALAGDDRIVQLDKDLSALSKEFGQMRKRALNAEQDARESTEQHDRLRSETNEKAWKRFHSRWFRLGQLLGFYK